MVPWSFTLCERNYSRLYGPTGSNLPHSTGPRRRLGLLETRKSKLEACGWPMGVGMKRKDLCSPESTCYHGIITEQPSRLNESASLYQPTSIMGHRSANKMGVCTGWSWRQEWKLWTLKQHKLPLIRTDVAITSPGWSNGQRQKPVALLQNGSPLQGPQVCGKLATSDLFYPGRDRDYSFYLWLAFTACKASSANTTFWGPTRISDGMV